MNLQREHDCRDEDIREEDDEVHQETYSHEVAEPISARNIHESVGW